MKKAFFYRTILMPFLLLSFISLIAQEGPPENGSYTKYYKSGKVKFIGQFKDSQPYGIFKYYFESGELQSQLEHLSPEEVKAIHYYQTGEKMAEGVYLNQKKQGLWSTYGAREIVVEQGNYISGKKYEVWKTFYPNGKLSHEVSFQNDLENGTFKKYFESGNLLQEGTYTMGYRQGKTVYYHQNGKVKVTGQYEKDTRDGKWVFFNEKGEEYRIIEFEEGRRLTPLFEDEEAEDLDLFKHQIKDELDYEDMEGKIKYDERK